MTTESDARGRPRLVETHQGTKCKKTTNTMDIRLLEDEAVKRLQCAVDQGEENKSSKMFTEGLNGESREIGVNLIPEYKVPYAPEDLRCELIWAHIDDETGMMTRQASEHNKMGSFALKVIQKRDMLEFTGIANPHEHSARLVPLNNHAHGMTFQVRCLNKCPHVSQELLWKRSLNNTQRKHELEEMDQNSFTLEGIAPLVPNLGCRGRGEFTLRKERGVYHIDAFKLVMGIAQFRNWINELDA